MVAGGALWYTCTSLSFCFGGTAPIIGVYVSDYFPASQQGTIYGLQMFSVAMGTSAFIALFGPDSHESPEFFLKPLTASFLGCGLAVVYVIQDIIMAGPAPKVKAKEL